MKPIRRRRDPARAWTTLRCGRAWLRVTDLALVYDDAIQDACTRMLREAAAAGVRGQIEARASRADGGALTWGWRPVAARRAK